MRSVQIVRFTHGQSAALVDGACLELTFTDVPSLTFSHLSRLHTSTFLPAFPDPALCCTGLSRIPQSDRQQGVHPGFMVGVSTEPALDQPPYRLGTMQTLTPATVTPGDRSPRFMRSPFLSVPPPTTQQDPGIALIAKTAWPVASRLRLE